MKVVELDWSFMTNTKKCPTLVGGVINSFTYFYKGEGQYTGRFPKVFAVVTDEAVVSAVTTHWRDSDPRPENIVSLGSMSRYYGVCCRDADSARKLAEKMAENPTRYQENTLYLAGNMVRLAPKLEVGKTVTVRNKGERPYKTVVVEITDADSDNRCAGCPWISSIWGCCAPSSVAGGYVVCTHKPNCKSFVRLMKLE